MGQGNGVFYPALSGADPALASGVFNRDYYYSTDKFTKSERVEFSQCYEADDQLSDQSDRGRPSQIPGGAESCFCIIIL